MNRLLTLLAAVLVMNTASMGQATLGAVAINSLQDTLVGDSLYSFNVTIRNTGDTLFIGSIQITMARDTMGFPLDVVQVDSVFGIILEPDSDFVAQIDHPFSCTRFTPGNNTVVIWPEAGPIGVTDTIRDTVFVICPTWIEENELAKVELVPFPNPTVDLFTISVPDNARLEEVLLYDMSGALVHMEMDRQVDMSSLAEGMYLVHARLEDGRFGMFKILKR